MTSHSGAQFHNLQVFHLTSMERICILSCPGVERPATNAKLFYSGRIVGRVTILISHYLCDYWESAKESIHRVCLQVSVFLTSITLSIV